MRTKFQLASGPLSYLKEVTVDLELRGKHFDQLAVADNASYERVVLSILSDLMDEDPYQLTMSEMYHLWLLIKVTSLGSKMSMSVKCHHVLEDKAGIRRECGCSNPYEFSLIDSDVVYAPADYEIPVIEFVRGKVPQKYHVRPPTMTQELDLLTYFQEKGTSRDALMNDVAGVLEYSKHRILLHLRNVETGDSFYDRKLRESAVRDISENSLLFIKRAGDLMDEVNSFGVSHKRMVLTCKECGGKLSFRLPLSAGISL
jgi:hypothetical protein